MLYKVGLFFMLCLNYGFSRERILVHIKIYNLILRVSFIINMNLKDINIILLYLVIIPCETKILAWIILLSLTIYGMKNIIFAQIFKIDFF